MTDVIRNGRFSTGSTPVPLTSPVYVSTPSDPAAGQSLPAEQDLPNIHDAGHRLLTGKRPPIPIPTPSKIPSDLPTPPSDVPSGSGSTDVKLPVPNVSPSASREGDFSFEPRCCKPDAGLKITYDSAEGRMIADLGLRLINPTFFASIDVDSHGIQDAQVRLSGAAAVDFSFDAATLDIKGNQPWRTLKVPLDISIRPPRSR